MRTLIRGLLCTFLVAAVWAAGAPTSGTIAVTTAGTSQRITASAGTFMGWIEFQADCDNTGGFFIDFDATVRSGGTAAGSLELDACESVRYTFMDLSWFHFDVDVNGEKAHYRYQTYP